MEYRVLGNTGLEVSRLCFGALTIGPLQSGLPVMEGAAVIRRALEGGVNFIDTAQLYGTYPYIREALKGWDREVIITSKSYAYTRPDMEKALSEALRELNRERVDIFLLHEQESALTIKGHWEALEYLLEAKKKGLVRAVGISTHAVAGVLGALKVPEIDVIHPMVNMKGIGIMDGSIAQMLEAVKQAYAAGIGIYGMKALGGGHLSGQAEEAIRFVLELEELSAVAMGMKTEAEVDLNLRIFSGVDIPDELRKEVKITPRKLHIEEWCLGCGKCIRQCPAEALELGSIEDKNRVTVNRQKCVLCGYCGAVCPDFCLKII